MDWLFLRSTFYGSPFLNLHAGRDMRDSENTARLRKAMRTFRASECIYFLPYSSQLANLSPPLIPNMKLQLFAGCPPSPVPW